MRKAITLIFLVAFTASFAQVAGTWKMSPQAAALGVGPELGDISWWSNSAADITLRACYFDDEYVFSEDGTFQNVLQDETWIEPWQGMDPEACGAPVAPHDGSNAATWEYDATEGTITLNGEGAYLGLSKVVNDGELSTDPPAPLPSSIVYPVEFNATGDTMTINIFIGNGYWRFILTTNAGNPPPPADDVSLPCTFDDTDLDYALTDFGGTTSTIIEDPSNSENSVVQTIRGDGAETWAGTTVAEPVGFVPAVPFTEELTQMRMRVFSPAAGIPVLFKLEVWNNTDISVETQTLTTLENEWETMYFDFSNEVEGTEPLNLENPYNKAVIFFNFGTAGADAGEQTYMWDDIEFVNPAGIHDNQSSLTKVYPNPATDVLYLENAERFNEVSIYSVTGQLVYQSTEVSHSISLENFPKGMFTLQAKGSDNQKYFAKFVVK